MNDIGTQFIGTRVVENEKLKCAFQVFGYMDSQPTITATTTSLPVTNALLGDEFDIVIRRGE